MQSGELKKRHQEQEQMMRKTILITGGAGFLGSHLCERLLADGLEVICLDNCFTGSKENIYHLINHPRFEFMRHDFTFPLYVEVDQIYNLACPASPIHYQFDPVQTTKTSVHGAINMLGLAKRVKARIMQASTSEVYGDPTIHPQPESYWCGDRRRPICIPRRGCDLKPDDPVVHSAVAITQPLPCPFLLFAVFPPGSQRC